MKNPSFRTVAYACIAVIGLWLPLFSESGTKDAWATAESGEESVRSLEQAIHHLLKLISQGKTAYDPKLAGQLIDFVDSAKTDADRYVPPGIEGTSSAYHEFELSTDLERFLSYTYNQDIPPHVFSPSSLRTAGYVPVGGEIRRPPLQWDFNAAMKTAQIVRLAEHEEITPDQFTGAYYEYDVDRVMILTTHEGRPVFFSIARQRDTSSVGKKGAILDPVDNWDYLYSGENGLTQGGLGWVDSYMYKAQSIAVFYPVKEKPSTLRCGIFKWLNAGWAGLNMVQGKHIIAGLERYARDLRLLIENPNLPPAEHLAQYYASLNGLSIGELQEKMKHYLAVLHKQYSENPLLRRKAFAKIFESGDYVRSLRPDQMIAALGLEYIKCSLGKPCRQPEIHARLTSR